MVSCFGYAEYHPFLEKLGFTDSAGKSAKSRLLLELPTILPLFFTIYSSVNRESRRVNKLLV